MEDAGPLECQACGRPGAEACGGCGALGWCPGAGPCRRAGRAQHARGGGECERMRRQRSTQLFGAEGGLPFAFGPGGGGLLGRCRALEPLGVHCLGIYAAECSCFAPGGLSGCPPLPADLPGPWRLREGGATVSPPHEVTDWSGFYRRRGLPPEHPAAVALHWPLTVHRCLAVSEAWGRIGASGERKPRLPRRLHLLGAGLGECHTLHTLAELGGLGWADGGGLEITLVGPGVPPECTGLVHAMPAGGLEGEEGPAWRCSCSGGEGAQFGNQGASRSARQGVVTAVCLRGRYGARLLAEGGVSGPDLAVAMNAGLPVFPEWEDSIEYVLAAGVPLFVTDLVEEAAVQARELVLAVAERSLPAGPAIARPGHWDVSKVEVNPFRQPLSSQGSDNRLPCSSNGFMFHARWAEAPQGGGGAANERAQTEN